MARNVEIKAVLRAGQMQTVRERALARATQPGQCFSQRDVFYHARRGRLKLRHLEDGSAVLVAYSRPDQAGPKTSSYTLYPCTEPVALHAALECSLGVRGVVKKCRELIFVGQTRVHLDRVEGLGEFVELEVVLTSNQTVEEGEAIATELAQHLDITPDALLDGAYMDLLESSST